MIDLNNYPKFKEGVQDNQTSIYPIIIINKPDDINGDLSNTVFISTVKETLKYSTTDPISLNFKDFGLNISNIKESIDIKDSKFKISNITLSLLNYEINGQRLSDYVRTSINSKVHVYYKTPSCTHVEDCLPVYVGTFRNINYDDNKLKISLEDFSQEIFHKDVPVANLGYSLAYNKHYRNKYVPITYGKVDKAPAVLYKSPNSDDASFYVISDNISVDSQYGINGAEIEIKNLESSVIPVENNYLHQKTSPLWIYKDDAYFNVNQEYIPINTGIDASGDAYSFSEKNQLSINTQNIQISKTFEFETATSPTSAGFLQTSRVLLPTSMEIYKGENEDGTSIDDSGNQISNLNPTISNIDGATDSYYNKKKFIVDKNYINTYTAIPQNNFNLDELTDTEVIMVNGLKLSTADDNSVQFGFWYPDDSIEVHQQNMGSYHYSWAGTHSAWRKTAYYMNNLHNYVDKVEVREMPCLDLMYERLEVLLEENYSITALRGKNELLNTGNPYNKLKPQQLIGSSGGLNEMWVNNQPIDVDAEMAVHGYTAGDYSFSDNTNQSSYLDGRHIIWNTLYPSPVYRFGVDVDDTVNNPNGYKWVLVGQEGGMVTGSNGLGSLDSDTIFINLFDEEEGRDYLFLPDDFCRYFPTERVANSWRHISIANLWVSPYSNDITTEVEDEGEVYYERYAQPIYKAEWNGVEANLLNNNYPWTKLQEKEYWGGYICQGEYVNFNNMYMSHQNDYADWCGSWALYFNDITLEKGGAKKHTWMSVGHSNHTNALTGGGSVHKNHVQHESEFLQNPDFFVLTSEGTDAASSRLTVLFPLDSTDVSDAIETRTFAFGKVKAGYPKNSEGNQSDMVQENIFQCRLSGAQASDDGTVDYSLNSNLSTELFDFELSQFDTIEGTTTQLIAHGNGFSSIDNFSYNNAQDMNSYKAEDFLIPDWTTPNQMNSVVLTYRLLSNDASGDGKFFNCRTEIYSVGVQQYIMFENAFENDFYMDTYGRANSSSDLVTVDIDGIPTDLYKYTNELYDPNDPKSLLLENPADIIYHFIEKELGYNDIVNRDNWSEARNNHTSYSLAFSIFDKINSKKLMEEISKNTFLFPKFKQDGTFGFANLKREYFTTDNHILIKEKDLIKFNIGVTPIGDINTIVNVKFNKDYAEDEYLEETGYCDGYDFYGNGDLGYQDGYRYEYYGIGREDKVLEFESDYIRDYNTAVQLRNFLYMQHCNQHTKIKMELPLHYSHLESGDTIKFDKIVNNLKSFGEDYTKETIRNGQKIYPYFIITSITKSTKSVKIECLQLHKLVQDSSIYDGTLVGDVGRMGAVDVNSYNELYSFLNGESKYFTELQKQLSDMDNNGYLDDYDLNMIASEAGIADSTASKDFVKEKGQGGQTN